MIRGRWPGALATATLNKFPHQHCEFRGNFLIWYNNKKSAGVALTGLAKAHLDVIEKGSHCNSSVAEGAKLFSYVVDLSTRDAHEATETLRFDESSNCCTKRPTDKDGCTGCDVKNPQDTQEYQPQCDAKEKLNPTSAV